MKSFIKNHKRSSSSPANTPDMAQQSQSEFYMSPLPLSSSNLQRSELTPPQIRSNKGISSPKKLFSPIKNLFSSPSQQKADSGVFKAGDQLKYALNATDKDKNKVTDTMNSSPRQRKRSDKVNNAYGRGPYGLNERQGHAQRPIKNKYADLQLSHRYRTDATFQNENNIHDDTTRGLASHTDQQESHRFKAFDISIPEDSGYMSAINQTNNQNGDPYISPRSLSESDALNRSRVIDQKTVSQLALGADRSNVESNAINEESEGLEESDDSSCLSENSSKFSFMQDKRGGRNTSVKYYKTAPSKKHDSNIANTFNEEDLGDIDDYSDYDYENNGLVDDLDDVSDNIREEEADVNGQYLKIFDTGGDDNISFKRYGDCLNVNRSYSPLDDKESVLSSGSGSLLRPSIPNVYVALLLLNQRVFNHSYHSSIEGFSIRDDKESRASSKQESLGDILENYLDSEDSSKGQNLRRTSQLINTNDIQLYEINSPLINGLTVGPNLRHRALHRKPRLKSSNDLGKLASKILIHRYNFSGNAEDYDRDVLQHRLIFNADRLLKMRGLPSFHTSISEEINLKIPEKIDAFEKSQKEKEESKNHQVHSNKEGATNENSHSKYGENIVFRFPKASDSNEIYSYKRGNTFVSGDHLNDQKNEPTVPENHHSLKAQEPDSSPLSSEEETNKTNIRNSISEMMSTLEILEKADKPNTSRMGRPEYNDSLLYSNAGNKSEGSSNRKSISDMMSTLKRLDRVPHAPTGHSETHKCNSRVQKVGKNFSDVRNFGSKNLPFWEANEKGYSIADRISCENQSQEDIYSNELIDEINTVPEDFDFETQNDSVKQYFRLELPFMRSNSYSKRPKKVINENSYNNNRIETPTKTVTVYRNKSKKSDEKGRNLNMGLYTRASNSPPKRVSEMSNLKDDVFLKTTHEKADIQQFSVFQDNSSKKSTESFRIPYSLNTIDEFDGMN